MKIVQDKNYCRRCKKFHISNNNKRTNYCQICKNKIAIDNNCFNKWYSSESFVEMSFIDCIERDEWSGFKDIKYDSTLVSKIIIKFPEIKHAISTNKRVDLKKYQKGNFIYLLSDNDSILLKVGQTQNLLNRFSHYYNATKNFPINYDIFLVDTYEKQDLYEDKIRNYLEFLGYLLPLDNTGYRLRYISPSIQKAKI